jgi:hypothetical protein
MRKVWRRPAMIAGRMKFMPGVGLRWGMKNGEWGGVQDLPGEGFGVGKFCGWGVVQIYYPGLGVACSPDGPGSLQRYFVHPDMTGMRAVSGGGL